MEIQPQTGTGTPGFFGRFGQVLSSPSALFASLTARPDFIWPVIFLLLTAGLSYPISRYTSEIMAEAYPEYAEILSAQRGQAFFVIGLISSLIGLAIAWLIRTGVFTLFARLLGGSPCSFKAAFSAVGYTYLPAAVQSVFQGGILLLTGALPPVGLEMGMELAERFKPAGILLGQINPFILGYLLLTVVALEKTFGLSRGKAVFVTLLCWGVALGLSVGMTALNTRFLQ